MAKIMERPPRMMTRIQVGVVDPSDPSASWGYGCLVGQQLCGQGGGDSEDGDDHQRGGNAAAGGGPLARGRVGHGGVWLALRIPKLSSSSQRRSEDSQI